MLDAGCLDVEKQENCAWDVSVTRGLQHLLMREGMGAWSGDRVPEGNSDTCTENFSVFSYYGNEQYRCVQIEMCRKRLWVLKQNS